MSSAGPKEVVLFGVAIAILPLTAGVLIPLSVGLPALFRPQFAAVSFVAIPVAFAYVTLRRRLAGLFPDLQIVIERTLVYGLMTILLAGGYFFFLYALHVSGRSLEADDNPLLFLLFFAAVTATFVPIRDLLRRGIDHLIYRDRYDSVQTLRTLSEQLPVVRPVEEVLGTVVDTLVCTMNLRGAAVLLRAPDGGFAMRAASGEYRDTDRVQALLNVPLTLTAVAPNPSRRGFRVPLIIQGEESGFLVLGPKRWQAEFTRQDLDLIETIVGQTALAITNIVLIERFQVKVAELELLRDRLLDVQQQERKQLANHLHDRPIQSILALVRRADTAAESLMAQETEKTLLIQQLRCLAERGRDVAFEVRTVCTDLYPSELKHLGLAAALADLARRTSRDEPILVSFSSSGLPDDFRLPDVVEDALYRCAREALNNVCRHARAHSVAVHLAVEHEQLTLRIQDDGSGFTMPGSTHALLQKGHLGLATVRERIEQIGGEFSVFSALGAGTEVRVRLSIFVDADHVAT